MFKNALQAPWNVMRILRLVMGVIIVYQGYTIGDKLLMIVGGFFALLPLLNVGCGANGACNLPNKYQKENKN